MTGNKGEWSELYVLLKLLAMGRLNSADENLGIIPDAFFPILKILREDLGRTIEYEISCDTEKVSVHMDSTFVREIPQHELSRIAAYFYKAICDGGNRAFEIENAEAVMKQLCCTRIAAPSTDKTDIVMQIHDIHTGIDPICGFSIKSELGSAPTLLNASGATNFVFEVFDIDDDEMEKINSIQTNTKIIDRIETISQFGGMKFSHTKNSVFAGNLMLIDTYMEEILALMLADYYHQGASDCKTLIERIERDNPLGYPREGIYRYKMKKFLCAIALGMTPSKEWNGHDEANGGYVIVRQDGNVVAYHLYNRDSFEEYLLNNTKFERGSIEKHGFATLYKDNGKMYINLNLQIRFI